MAEPSKDIVRLARELPMSSPQREPLLRVAKAVETLEAAHLASSVQHSIRVFLLRLQSRVATQRLATASDVIEEAFEMLGPADASVDREIRQRVRDVATRRNRD